MSPKNRDIVAETGNIVAKNTICCRFRRQCRRFWRHCRGFWRHCRWCGRGFTSTGPQRHAGDVLPSWGEKISGLRNVSNFSVADKTLADARAAKFYAFCLPLEWELMQTQSNVYIILSFAFFNINVNELPRHIQCHMVKWSHSNLRHDTISMS